MEKVIEELRSKLQPLFPIKKCDEIDAFFHSKSIRNMKSQGNIPGSCFCYEGKRVLIHRDNFLNWFAYGFELGKEWAKGAE